MQTKRLLSLALALVMVLSLLPTIALAADSAPALPTAKVSQIKNDDLTFAMNFRVNSVTEEQLAYYGNWYADFELTINKEVTFNNDGSADGWLAGQYDEWSYDWVTVPFGNKAPVTLEANQTVKLMAFAAEFMDEPGLKYTFKEVYETVKDFNCGVYFDDEFLAANPDLVVTLELKMYNPANEAESYLIGETYTYTNPIVAQNINTGKVYASVSAALMDAQERETVILLKDTSDAIVSVYTDCTLDLNGYALAANYVSSFGDIIDSSAANTGLLAVAPNRFMIRKDNAQLPIRKDNGYCFADVLKFNAKYDAASSTFGFQPFIEANMLEWLKNGAATTGVTIQVQISWKQSQGYRTQNFVYNDETVNKFLNSYSSATGKYSQMLFLTLKGAENFEELTFTAMVVSETKVTFTPDSLANQKPAGNVTTDANNQVVNDVTIGNGNASALVPSGTQLENGAYNVTLSATAMDKTTSNITLGDDEQLVSMNVHVNGVAANNTKPIIVTLANLAIEGLNQGNINLYHVENGQTVLMTRVYSLAEVDAHNEYYYDIATGTVTMALATFSEIAVRSNVRNEWNGTIDTDWYNTADTEFDIYNADQLAGLGAIVGGMAAGIERDSFKGKKITLYADINLADDEKHNDENKLFYPIGYWNNTLSYNHVSGKVTVDGVETAVSSGFYPFEGTFDGNGNTIANFYQNTWEMFGDYNDGYSGTPNYYRDGMGLFGKVYGGTIKNLTVDHFSSDGEYTTTGCIAAYADCGAQFINISITNCNPRVYNIGNGGIVGAVGWYGKETSENPVTFRNITVDNTNKISALWGSWDVACGGIVGQYYPTSGQSAYDNPPSAGLLLDNCHVAAQIDVYNDVCANYQYYAYRYAGMLIGSVRENVTIGGHSYPDMTGITATGCTAFFGDWNDYYYCELVANTQASYTHDYQMSRLTQVLSVDVENMKVTDLDGNVSTIPDSGRYNYVVVKNKDPETGAWIHGDGHEFADCYHFVDGEVWNHEQGGYEEKDINGDGNIDNDVLKEDKQLVYREFNNLVTGYGWGVTSRGFNNLGGVENFGVKDGDGEDSIVKFVPVVGAGTSLNAGKAVSIGKLFAANTGATSAIGIKSGNVQVFVSPADDTSTVRGSYVGNAEDWTKGALVLRGTGKAVVTITDYYYCTATTLIVDVLDEDAVIEYSNLIANGTFGEVGTIDTYTIAARDVVQRLKWTRPNGFGTVYLTNKFGVTENDYAIKVKQEPTSTSASSFYQVIPLEGVAVGTKIKLTADAQGTVVGTKDAYMRLAFYADTTASTPLKDEKGNGIGKSSGYLKTSDDWVSYSVETTVPEGAVSVRVFVAYAAKAGDVELYVDNTVLTIGNDTTNHLTNASFDDLSGLSDVTPTINKENNLFVNGEGWDKNGAQFVGDNATNNAYMYLDGTDASIHAWGAHYDVEAIAGATYNLTFAYKSTTPVRWYLNEYDKDGTRTDQQWCTLEKADSWTTLEFTYQLRDDTVKIRIYPYYANADNMNGEACFDNFVLTKACVHTWGEADVIEAATCTKAGTSVRTCTDCGATETVSAKIAHAWNNGVCASCKLVCQHKDVYGGVCLICNAERPESITEHNDNMISGGDFNDKADWAPSKEVWDEENKELLKGAYITDGWLKLYDNTNSDYPTTYNEHGLAIDIGKTYVLELDYVIEDASEGFYFIVAPRGNGAWGSTGLLLTTKNNHYYQVDGKTKADPTHVKIEFTATADMRDPKDNPIDTLFVMFYTPGKGTGTVWIDNVSLTKKCESHVWGDPIVVAPTCTKAGSRTVTCIYCDAVGVSEIPALKHVEANGFCVRCKEELM